MGTIENVVAFGTLIESKITTNIVNGESLGDQWCCVSIDVLINGVALLSRKVNNKEMQVKQVIGKHVAWSKDLVVILEKKNTIITTFLLDITLC